ncbi:hypothetical protein LTR94_024771 [Friedmanniomyces endolithicus]|nr:hypothetical protein LTR94_024771 [Friedmanniomyces endolithicus]
MRDPDRRELHFGRIGDFGVMLDLSRDRYVGLPPTTAAPLLDLAGRLNDSSDVPSETRGLIAALIGDDSVMGAERLKIGLSQGETPRRSIYADKPNRRSAGQTANALMALTCLIQVRSAHDNMSMATFISWLRRQKHRHRRAPATPAQIASALNGFSAVRPWYPVKPVCRIDHPAIALLLWKKGVDASLIWGAALHPFRAHCWVQAGDIAINETDEAARDYAPILSI